MPLRWNARNGFPFAQRRANAASTTGNTMTNEVAFSPDEAAHRAGVGRTLIFSEIKNGRLEARKAGARTIITIEALHNWLGSLPIRQSLDPAKSNDRN
ncbi:MAG: hypothetical protein WAL15_19535 [Xanthobacteraceae bacterium]